MPLPDGLDPRCREALARHAGSTALYAPPGRGARARRQRGEHVARRDRHGERQDARLQPAGARRARRRPEASRALPLPDEGARAGSGPRARRRSGCRASAPAIYDGDTRARAPLADPQVGERDPHEPRHAPRRRPAAPRPLGRRAREPRATSSSTRRTSTAASSARTSRTSCAGCAGSRASTAPSRSSCSRRRRSRNPGELGARARSAWTSPSSTTTPRRAPSARSRFWNPPLLDEELGLRASALGEAARLLAELVETRPAHDLLREEPQGGRARPPLRRASGSTPRWPRRLSPYRAGYTPAQRREIERRLVEGELLGVTATDALELGIDVGLLDCADLGRLPGHGREPAPAVGPGGPPRARARRARRERGRARPVLHARAGGAARPPRRGGDPRPREPARSSTATCARRPSRRRSTSTTAPSLGDAGARARRGARASGRPEARRRPATSGRAATIPPARFPLRSTSPDCGRGRRRRDGHGPRPRRARARVLDRARGRRLPPPRRVLPRARRSTSTARAALVEPFAGDYYTQTKKETHDRDRASRPRWSGGSGVDLCFGRRLA